MREFERRFAEYIGADHAIAVNSCTAALHLALLASDIGPGDEVITTPLTFCATANVIVHTGATPVFADIDPVTCNLSPLAAEHAFTKRHARDHSGALRGPAGRRAGVPRARRPRRCRC